MKINLRKPRFVIPLILLPFILLFYYIFYSWGGKTVANTPIADSLAAGQLNPNMPGVSAEVKDAELKDKFGAYLEAYKHNKDASALDNINNTDQALSGDDLRSAYSPEDLKRLQAQRKMDSLQRELKAGQQDIDRQIARIYSNTRRQSQAKPTDDYEPITPEQLLQNFNQQKKASSSPEKEDARDHYNEQISLFRDQMAIMDSMQQAYTARSDQGGQSAAGSLESTRSKAKTLTNNFDNQRFDPEKDSSFKPLAVKRAVSQTSGFNTVAVSHPDKEIKAIIDQEVRASAGSRVRIRLLNEIYVGEYLIPKGTYLYGIVTGFQTQRINVSITQVMLDNIPLPVKLDVFDTDGYLGLYVPGSTFREFTKEIGTQGTQGLSQVRTSDNSNVTTGLVNQLFQSSSTSVSKLIRKEKALLKYNYIVYLKERK